MADDLDRSAQPARTARHAGRSSKTSSSIAEARGPRSSTSVSRRRTSLATCRDPSSCRREACRRAWRSCPRTDRPSGVRLRQPQPPEAGNDRMAVAADPWSEAAAIRSGPIFTDKSTSSIPDLVPLACPRTIQNALPCREPVSCGVDHSERCFAVRGYHCAGRAGARAHAHRSGSGIRARTSLACMPHPRHVVLPQSAQRAGLHIISLRLCLSGPR